MSSYYFYTRQSSQPAAIVIHPRDNVATALRTLERGEILTDREGRQLMLTARIEFAHKVALARIAPSDRVLKYGLSIGRATREISPGDWVHLDNLVTNQRQVSSEGD